MSFKEDFHSLSCHFRHRCFPRGNFSIPAGVAKDTIGDQPFMDGWPLFRARQAGGPKGLGYFTEKEFAEWVKPEEMISPTKWKY